MRGSSDDSKYFDFGHETASNDLAWTNDLIDEFFIQTDAIRDFLTRAPTRPFIAGPKGSGKSLLLFKRLLHARMQPGVIVLPHHPVKAYGPALDFSTAPFWHLFKDDKPVMQLWGSLWSWALCRTIIAGWYEHERTSHHEKTPRMATMAELIVDRRHDPFELVFDYLHEVDAGHNRRRGRPLVPDVSELRNFIVRNADEFPPTYLFIDNHDDAFEEQPEYWIASAYGAFLAIEELHAITNRRIHCMLTLRPEVIWRLRESQHFPKWSRDIFQIAWEDHELMALFRIRASYLHRSLLARPDLAQSDPMHAFFGDELLDPTSGKITIRAVNLETDEPIHERVESYLLRHTLRRPRDLIVVGNQILEKLRSPVSAGEGRARRIRDGINAASRVIRDGYLAECESRWPWHGGDASLKSFIKRYIRFNIIPQAEQVRINREFAERIDRDPAVTDPLAALVTFGLLGFPVPDANHPDLVQRFLRPDESTSAQIPLNADHYLVHPVLYGDPFHIQPVKGQAVGPGLPFDPMKVNWEPRISQGARRSSLPDLPNVTVFSWIHLSDLHFGAGNVAHRFDQKAVTRSILRDIETNAPKNPNFIFVTGDIAFSAKPAQYKEASNWFDELAKTLRIERERIRLVPGNHDVDRSKAAKVLVSDIHARVRSNPPDLDERLADEDARKALAQKLEPYAAFAKKYGPASRRRGALEIDWAEAQRIDPYGYPIRLVGLSSVWVSDASDGCKALHIPEPFVPNMVLGPGQIRSKLDGTAADELLFLLTHHPPEWYHQLSAETLSSSLSRKTHVHLCGHVHDASARAMKRFGASLRSVRCVAGAAHGSPSERDHGYAWGALRWNSRRARWEVGWAPRVYRSDPEGMYPMSYPLDSFGYAWEEIDLPWSPPPVPNALPHPPSSSMRWE